MLDESSRLPTRQELHDGVINRDGVGESDALGVPGSLAYGVLVNASAVHGAPIFMNLVNSAALQAVVDAVGLKDGDGGGQGNDGPAGDGAAAAGGDGADGREEKAMPRCVCICVLCVFCFVSVLRELNHVLCVDG